MVFPRSRIFWSKMVELTNFYWLSTDQNPKHSTARSFLAVRHLAWQFDGHCLALVTIWFPMSMFLFLLGAKKSHCRCKGDLKSSPLWLPQGFLPTEKSSPRLKPTAGDTIGLQFRSRSGWIDLNKIMESAKKLTYAKLKS